MRIPLFTNPTPFSSRNWNDLRVGLLGGTFNPPHKGHLHIAEIALKWLNLDCIWWVVAPQNPHKEPLNNSAFSKRLALCENLVHHPRMLITDIEHQYQSQCTFDTLSELKKDFPKTNFVWVGGTDLVENFHLWEGWQDLINLVPFAFIHRPPSNGLIKKSPVSLSHFQHIHMNSPLTRKGLESKTIYWIKRTPANPESSTRIRNT